MCRSTLAAILSYAMISTLSSSGYALDGGTLRMTPRNGWRALEVISVGDNPTGDGLNWAMPGTFDGLGAWLPDAATLRLQVNHENLDATISEVDLNLAQFQTAIRNMIGSGATGGVSFVESARQAYGRWTADGGSHWTDTVDISTTSFYRFCSSQSYRLDTFGPGRGFVDNIYITGEEGSPNRLFALDLTNHDFYQLSGVTGSANGGIGGIPYDPYENAALLDTGETNHVALMISPDGGSQRMQLYVGEKGKDESGNSSDSFLARNGLAYGSYYYFKGTLPTNGTSAAGFFDTTTTGSLVATKLEDVDTNPNNPAQAVLAVQESGLFTFDFSLDFSRGNFDAGGSSFSITKIQQHTNDTAGEFGDADNVDWTEATTLGGVNYPNGLIFVNEDSETANGETWMNAPDGSGLTLIGDTIGINGATETSGVLDVSKLVGYRPGSILLTDNQGIFSSLTVLIHPQATLAADYNANGVVDAADYTVWRDSFGQSDAGLPADGNANGQVDVDDYDFWRAEFGTGFPRDGAGSGSPAGDSVPEPTSCVSYLMAAAPLLVRRKKRN